MRLFAMACAAALLACAAPDMARAAIGEAVTTADLNLRSGPGTGYPVLATLPAGSMVTVNACLPSRQWCDVSWRGRRGWAFAAYLAFQRNIEPGPWVGGPVILYEYGDHPDRYRRYRKDDRRPSRPHGKRPGEYRPHKDNGGHDGGRPDRRRRPSSGGFNPDLPGVGQVPGRPHSRPPERPRTGGDRFPGRTHSQPGGGCDPSTGDCGQPRGERRGSARLPDNPPQRHGDPGRRRPPRGDRDAD